MLLRENKNSYGDFMLNFPNALKTPTYMPPIKPMDKQMKAFYSPTGLGQTRTRPLYPDMPSPHREHIQNNKLKPMMAKPNSSLLREHEFKLRLPHEKQKSLSLSTNNTSNFKSSSNLTPRDHYPNHEEAVKPTKPSQFLDSSDSTDADSNNQDSKPTITEPANTLDTFMQRLARLQTRGLLPNYEPSRASDKAHGIVKGFAVCTNQGLVRNYNEDRVSIVLNILRPANKDSSEYWPNISIFAVFDGHGGNKCAEFLRNNLHHYIIRNKNFPWNPTEALKEAFEEADTQFLQQAETSEDGKHDKSGSCALVMLIIDDTCYISNLGDSRAILSQGGGGSRMAVTRDHKPSDKLEQKRITDGGGKIYQQEKRKKIITRNFPLGVNGKRLDLDPKTNPFQVTIPFRILPGRLSVSRAFGDIEAKNIKFGGNPNVLISRPEITTIKINKEHDFIVLGCDGIYDKLSNEDVIGIVWDTFKKKDAPQIHEGLKIATENILKESLLKKSLDNVTAIVVAFSNLDYKTSTFDMPEARPVSKKEMRISHSRAGLRKSEDFDIHQSKLLGNLPTHHSVSSVNLLPNTTPMSGVGFDSVRLKTPMKNPTLLKEKFDSVKTSDHVRKSSGGLPKLQLKSPKGEITNKNF